MDILLVIEVAKESYDTGKYYLNEINMTRDDLYIE
jgi:hypothetical protein